MSENQWYYAVGDQHQGPVPWEQLQQMSRDGHLSPEQFVWREGMDQWAAAATVEGLFAGPPPIAVVQVAYARPIDTKTQKILKNAKQNCIAMFVLFVIAAPLSLVAVVLSASTYSGTGVPQGASGCCPCIWPLASLFAAIYLPLRWQYLKQISSTVRTLGLIGGFGLIGMFVLGLIAILIGVLGFL